MREHHTALSPMAYSQPDALDGATHVFVRAVDEGHAVDGHNDITDTDGAALIGRSTRTHFLDGGRASETHHTAHDTRTHGQGERHATTRVGSQHTTHA